MEHDTSLPTPVDGTDQVGFDTNEGQWYAMQYDEEGEFFDTLDEALAAWSEWHTAG